MKKSIKNSLLSLFILLTTTAEVTHASMLPRWQMILTESQLSSKATQNNAPVKGQFKTFIASIFLI